MKFHLTFTEIEMNTYLNELQAAITGKDKRKILALYDHNIIMDSWQWDKADEAVKQRYDDLTDQANEVLGI